MWIVLGLWTGFPVEWLLATNLLGTMFIFFILIMLQHSRQMHMRSIHAKLNELIRAGDGGNHFIGSERLADEMLEALRASHRETVKRDGD